MLPPSLYPFAPLGKGTSAHFCFGERWFCALDVRHSRLSLFSVIPAPPIRHSRENGNPSFPPSTGWTDHPTVTASTLNRMRQRAPIRGYPGATRGEGMDSRLRGNDGMGAGMGQGGGGLAISGGPTDDARLRRGPGRKAQAHLVARWACFWVASVVGWGVRRPWPLPPLSRRASPG